MTRAGGWGRECIPWQGQSWPGFGPGAAPRGWRGSRCAFSPGAVSLSGLPRGRAAWVPHMVVWGKQLSCQRFAARPFRKVAPGKPFPSSSGFGVQIIHQLSGILWAQGGNMHSCCSQREGAVRVGESYGKGGGEHVPSSPAGSEQTWDALGQRAGTRDCSEKACPSSKEQSLGKAPPGRCRQPRSDRKTMSAGHPPSLP